MDKLSALKKYFGYTSFRPGQESLIDALLQGRDVLGIMPTGAGKSLCYQIPALLLPGITLVISPLISLMQDQVQALETAGIQAAYINSSLSGREFYATLDQARAGAYKLIYVAPERLETVPGFRQRGCHFHGGSRRSSLYFPVGTGFPAQLHPDPGFPGIPAGKTGGGSLYRHGHGAGPG